MPVVDMIQRIFVVRPCSKNGGPHVNTSMAVAITGRRDAGLMRHRWACVGRVVAIDSPRHLEVPIHRERADREHGLGSVIPTSILPFEAAVFAVGPSELVDRAPSATASLGVTPVHGRPRWNS
jgi:hypothetical protein